HRESTESEGEIFINVHSLPNKAHEILVFYRCEADSSQPALKFSRRREKGNKLGNFPIYLRLGRCLTRQPLRFKSEKSLIYQELEGTIKVFGGWLIDRASGLKRKLPQKIAVGY